MPFDLLPHPMVRTQFLVPYSLQSLSVVLLGKRCL